MEPEKIPLRLCGVLFTTLASRAVIALFLAFFQRFLFLSPCVHVFLKRLSSGPEEPVLRGALHDDNSGSPDPPPLLPFPPSVLLDDFPPPFCRSFAHSWDFFLARFFRSQGGFRPSSLEPLPFEGFFFLDPSFDLYKFIFIGGDDDFQPYVVEPDVGLCFIASSSLL